MKRAIEKRELFTFEGPNTIIRGTYHKPPCSTAAASTEVAPRGNVGILFLNGLYATRSSTGDVAVYWADSIAGWGYHCFRIDLPGYGDSDGDLPEDCLGFINRGGYAPVAATVMDSLVARYRLSGLVIIGHCSGAVSALYTAAAAGRQCLGLVLMDPYFHLSQEASPGIRQSLRVWAVRSQWGGLLSRLYDIVKQLRLLIGRNTLPPNANLAGIRCWKNLATAGLPILLLRSPGRGTPGIKLRPGEFDYCQHVLALAGRRSKIVVKIMEGANHSFSNRTARNSVLKNTEEWLAEYFPLITPSRDTSEETMPMLA